MVQGYVTGYIGSRDPYIWMDILLYRYGYQLDILKIKKKEKNYGWVWR